MTFGALELAKRAQQDMVGIHQRIARDNSRAADEFIGRLFDTLATIASQKYVGERRDDLRRRLRIFSYDAYVICFIPMRNGVRILRVLHGSRDWSALFRPR